MATTSSISDITNVSTTEERASMRDSSVSIDTIAPYRSIGDGRVGNGGGGGGGGAGTPFSYSRFLYFHLDHLGSPRVITKSDGSVLSQHHYMPFGEEMPLVAQGSGNTRQFTGQERDLESGLDYMLARYYSSSLGRFMAVDRGDADLVAPQSWNKYAYVRNNPLIYKDPSGKDIYWTSESGFDDFITVLGRAMDDSVLMDELLAHECSDCPNLYFDGEKPGLTDEDGKPAEANTDGRIDPETGEYKYSRIATNPDLLHEVDKPGTLIHEMGHVHDFRTNSEEAVRDSNRGERGKRAKDYRAERFRKDSDERRKKNKEVRPKPCIGCDPPQPYHILPKTIHYARASKPSAKSTSVGLPEVV